MEGILLETANAEEKDLLEQNQMLPRSRVTAKVTFIQFDGASGSFAVENFQKKFNALGGNVTVPKRLHDRRLKASIPEQ